MVPVVTCICKLQVAEYGYKFQAPGYKSQGSKLQVKHTYLALKHETCNL